MNNRKQPQPTGEQKATTVETVFPSKNGNYRVKLTFSNGSIKHFYMKPDGTLHVPDKHKEKSITLDDAEMAWCEKAWKKGNPDVRKQTITMGTVFQMALALALQLRTTENKKAAQQKPKVVSIKTATPPKKKPTPQKGGGNTFGSVFGGILTAIKQKLPKTGN